MTAWTLGRLRASGEAYLRELGQARVLELQGRPAPDAASIRGRYDYELGRGAVDLALELADLTGPDTPDARSARLLLAWLAQLEVARVCAPMDEWIFQWRGSAVVRSVDGRTVPFAEADRAIARERDRASRLRLDSARTEVAERELIPTLLERESRARDAIEAIGIGGTMIDVAGRLSGADLAALANAARDALKQSLDPWRDSLGERLHRQAGLSIGEARPSDVSAAIDTSAFDGAFRPSMRSITMRRLVAEMGLDPDADGRLRIGPAMLREAPDAACVAVDVPREVHIILGAEGGFAASRDALRALGSALGLVHTQEDAHFEYRWLGDRGAREIGGLTLGLVLQDGEWLMRYAGVGRSEAEKIVRVAALAALHEIRHACATFLYYVEAVDAGLPSGARQELYADIIGGAIGVPPHASDAVLRAPPLLDPCARLHAWQAASVLADELVQRFDVDWYRNPRAGPWLVQGVFAPACGETAAEVVKGAAGRDPSLSAYLTNLGRLLAA